MDLTIILIVTTRPGRRSDFVPIKGTLFDSLKGTNADYRIEYLLTDRADLPVTRSCFTHAGVWNRLESESTLDSLPGMQ